MGIPWCVICCFSLAAFNICYLCLIFVNLINKLSWGFLPWVYPVWDSPSFLDLDGYFLTHFREVFNYYLLQYYLMAFLFVFFCDSCDSNVGAFDIVLEVSDVVLVSFNAFFLFSSLLHLFPAFYLPPHLSYLLPQLFYCWFPPECFWSVIALYIIDWLFFISPRSLLNIFCIFSILVSRLSVTLFCFQDFGSFLLSLFWILFQVDSLFPPLLFGLVGICCVSLPA